MQITNKMGNLQAANRAALYQVLNNQQPNNRPAQRQQNRGEISSPLKVLSYDQANDGYIPGKGKNIST